MTETITETELADAMERMNYGRAGKKLAKDLFEDIKAHRSEDSKPLPETITVAELKEALGKLTEVSNIGAYLTPGKYANRFDLANAILATARDTREPEYPVGTVVKDNNGVWWRRSSLSYWVKFGDGGRFPDHQPVRPLRKIDG